MSCNDLYHYSVVVEEVFEMKLKKGKKPLKKAKDLPNPGSEMVNKEALGTQGSPEPDDGKVDYGGLPAIDLKKNLGCG